MTPAAGEVVTRLKPFAMVLPIPIQFSIKKPSVSGYMPEKKYDAPAL